MTRIGWVGFHMEGIPALEALLSANAPVSGVITLEPVAAAKRSANADYRELCERFRVPLYLVRDINDSSAIAILRELSADILFVIGWSQILRSEALRTARIGVIGAHASALPHNRGSAPINWAILRGERESGNTLMWLSEGVDEGEIIDQMKFPITPYDTCATLYDAVAETNRAMILRLLPSILAGRRPESRPQTSSSEPLLPRRRPSDGLIDWDEKVATVYDFVRALTRPYPGAFSFLNGQKWIIWSAAQLPTPRVSEAHPGDVLGSVVSPIDAACGQAVATGRGSLLLLELEGEDGVILRGRDLSEMDWTGQRWTNG